MGYSRMTMGESVEVVLRGGLGNQMFQYALGRFLSIKLRLPLLVDASALSTDGQVARNYELGCFRLTGLSMRQQPSLLAKTRDKVLRRLGIPSGDSTYLIKERSLAFDADVLRLDGPCRLEGYWQSERYFRQITSELRRDFELLSWHDGANSECAARMSAVKSVALHIRRADYATSPVASVFHGTCPREYYDAALGLMQSRLGADLELFVFSDDMDWARANMRFGLPTTFVDWNRQCGHDDLQLMSRCRALVMANSTFSWWAGWLNRHTDKLAVAPRRWFKAAGVRSDLPNSPWVIAL
jgi:hypothetical protein